MADPSLYSALLKLPGELRNRIHNFAIGSATLTLKWQPDTNPEDASPCSSLSIESRRFFGLAQVSRQLRSEVLPLFQAHRKFVIPHRDVARFRDTFLILVNKATRNPVINIAIQFDRYLTVDDIDFMSLVRLLAQTPINEIQILDAISTDSITDSNGVEVPITTGMDTFLYEHHPEARMVKVLSACISNSKFREYALAAISSITYLKHNRQIWLEINPAHAKPWIRGWNDAAMRLSEGDAAAHYLEETQWDVTSGLSKSFIYKHVWLRVEEEIW